GYHLSRPVTAEAFATWSAGRPIGVGIAGPAGETGTSSSPGVIGGLPAEVKAAVARH
ncbi:MAG: hypothetical protein QOE58_3357, partial [Actinomycetota bacterium]|nr:hypothetical protein [Actinomycetota bacterium]